MDTIKTLDEMIERSRASPLWALRSDERLILDDFSAKYQLYDLADGAYIVRPIIELNRGRTRIRALLDTTTTLPIEVFGGEATVERDYLNGNILIRPRADQTVSARPVVTTTFEGRPVKLAGSDIEVGINPTILGAGEEQTAVRGGGACATDVKLPGGNFNVKVQVRAAVTATAMPKTLTRREVEWRNGRYFAYDPVIGFISLYYNPAKISRSIIETNNADFAVTRQDFFPARTTNSLYFMCDLIDVGITAFSKTPMRQTLAAATWPPFSTQPINIDEPVEFFDVRDPDRLVMRLESQEMYLYDYNSIDIALIDHRFDGDILTTSWEIRNQSDSLIFGRWFLLGDFEREADRPYEGNRMLGRSGSVDATARVEVSVRVAPSVLTQRVMMSCVSLRDPILAGQTSFSFRHPS